MTVLTAFDGLMVKRFYLADDGDLACQSYGQESHFSARISLVNGLADVFDVITQTSEAPRSVLIRGAPAVGLAQPARRKAANFPEPEQGRRWLMLDFDNIEVPAGIDACSVEAIERAAILNLPAEFHNASYAFQFSGSAGIFRPDGSPWKSGLNVHLFFWLDRPITGKLLEAYLIRHCIDTGFYERTFNRAGSPWIKWGIDTSVVRTPVQPLYVARPVVGTGVVCRLSRESRQGLINKELSAVCLPELHDQLRSEVVASRRQLLDEHKRQCGYVESRSVTRSAQGGISVSSFFQAPALEGPQRDRVLTSVEFYDDDQDAAVFYFEDENSAGSWYVTKSSPTRAQHFGGQLSMLLRIA